MEDVKLLATLFLAVWGVGIGTVVLLMVADVIAGAVFRWRQRDRW